MIGLSALSAPDRAEPSLVELFGLRGSQRTRGWVALALALLTVATEAASLAGWIPDFSLGRIVVSASAIPAAALAVLLGRALLGRALHQHAALAYWICAATAALLCTVAYRRLAHPADLPGLVAAAFDEELVYRLAVPAVVAVVLGLAGIRPKRAWIFGFLVGGVWFVLLPGHRAQWTNLTSILAFAAFAAVMALVVYRSGSIAAAALAHLCADLLTILVWNDVFAREERSAALGVVLVLLVLAYGTTSRRKAPDTVIDLRAGRVPTVRNGHGTPVPIGETADDTASPAVAQASEVPRAGHRRRTTAG